MKKLILLVIGFLSYSTAAFAVLPPLWQDVAEIKAIVSDQKLANYLQSGESIIEVKKVEDGWLIITNQHALPIKINYKKAMRPGPSQFTIEFGTLQPK